METKKQTGFKITICEPELLTNSFKVIHELVNEVKLNINKDCLEIIELDPANVSLIHWKLLSSACIEYDVSEEEVIGLNVQTFLEVLKKITKEEVLSLERGKSNDLVMTIKGRNTKRTTIPLLDITDMKKEKIPELEFKAGIVTNSKQLETEFKYCDSIADSVRFNCSETEFKLESKGDLNTNITILKADEITKIDEDSKAICRYSLEYLKMIIKAKIISNDVRICFSDDYPLSVVFENPDNIYFNFILAPRVEND